MTIKELVSSRMRVRGDNQIYQDAKVGLGSGARITDWLNQNSLHYLIDLQFISSAEESR